MCSCHDHVVRSGAQCRMPNTLCMGGGGTRLARSMHGRTQHCRASSAVLRRCVWWAWCKGHGPCPVGRWDGLVVCGAAVIRHLPFTPIAPTHPTRCSARRAATAPLLTSRVLPCCCTAVLHRQDIVRMGYRLASDRAIASGMQRAQVTSQVGGVGGCTRSDNSMYSTCTCINMYAYMCIHIPYTLIYIR